MRLLLHLAVMLIADPALAWGEYGHRTIARIAAAELTPQARRAVAAILAKGATVDTPGCPLATLEDASVWPDCVRSLPDRFKFSFPWHYQNIDVCTAFDPAAKCADGECVTAQIPRQLAIAADATKSPAERAQALAFVVHFTGDMHQPLHIGEKHDKGGNDVIANYGVKAPPKMNLHRIWDSELAERAISEPPAVGPATPRPADRRHWPAGRIAGWARESWELSRTLTYPALRGYPDTCAVPPAGRALVDEAYVAAVRDAVRSQVAKAGVRLAALLNRAFAGHPRPNR